jgi:hypothetical protein
MILGCTLKDMVGPQAVAADEWVRTTGGKEEEVHLSLLGYLGLLGLLGTSEIAFAFHGINYLSLLSYQVIGESV